jgi:hypothetical protein
MGVVLACEPFRIGIDVQLEPRDTLVAGASAREFSIGLIVV